MATVLVRSCLVHSSLFVVLGLPALAQHGGHGGPPSGGGSGMPQGSSPGGDMQGGGFPPDAHGGPPAFPGSSQGGLVSTMRGGLQLGPPGRWWDDHHFAKELKLNPDQQKRMDAVLDGNKGQLVSSLQALQQEETKMETLTKAQSLDEAALFSQIDRVTQARASLEKANTHFLLLIRKEMDPDQLERLEQHR